MEESFEQFCPGLEFYETSHICISLILIILFFEDFLSHKNKIMQMFD